MGPGAVIPQDGTYRSITVEMMGDVALVRFQSSKLIEDVCIQEAGLDLFSLVRVQGCKKVVVSCAGVDYIASTMMGKFITLDKMVKAAGGQLRFADVRPEIYEVFAITKLNRLFDIRDSEEEALASF